MAALCRREVVDGRGIVSSRQTSLGSDGASREHLSTPQLPFAGFESLGLKRATRVEGADVGLTADARETGPPAHQADQPDNGRPNDAASSAKPPSRPKRSDPECRPRPLSRITWRTSVVHQPSEDNCDQTVGEEFLSCVEAAGCAGGGRACGPPAGPGRRRPASKEASGDFTYWAHAIGDRTEQSCFG